jgi:hypothetical protein
MFISPVSEWDLDDRRASASYLIEAASTAIADCDIPSVQKKNYENLQK